MCTWSSTWCGRRMDQGYNKCGLMDSDEWPGWWAEDLKKKTVKSETRRFEVEACGWT